MGLPYYILWTRKRINEEKGNFTLIRGEGEFYLDKSDMKAIAKSQREFDEKRWESTQHIMT